MFESLSRTLHTTSNEFQMVNHMTDSPSFQSSLSSSQKKDYASVAACHPKRVYSLGQRPGEFVTGCLPWRHVTARNRSPKFHSLTRALHTGSNKNQGINPYEYKSLAQNVNRLTAYVKDQLGDRTDSPKTSTRPPNRFVAHCGRIACIHPLRV